MNKVLWFTGLSGSGKTTLARALEADVVANGGLVCVLDGDVLREGLCSDLGFSVVDRRENLRRVLEVARIVHSLGVLVVVSFISPFLEERAVARGVFGSDFVEVFVSCPLSVCESRDPKGLYRQARLGLLKDFTGLSSPFEPPVSPEVVVRTDKLSVRECVGVLGGFV